MKWEWHGVLLLLLLRLCLLLLLLAVEGRLGVLELLNGGWEQSMRLTRPRRTRKAERWQRQGRNVSPVCPQLGCDLGVNDQAAVTPRPVLARPEKVEEVQRGEHQVFVASHRSQVDHMRLGSAHLDPHKVEGAKQPGACQSGGRGRVADGGRGGDELGGRAGDARVEGRRDAHAGLSQKAEANVVCVAQLLHVGTGVASQEIEVRSVVVGSGRGNGGWGGQGQSGGG
jgi:hypothetical protein